MLPPKYDPLDPALIDDPYPVYARLRDAAPLCRGGVGQWVLTRHADVAAALRDSRLGHEFPDEYHRFSLGDGVAASFFRRILLYRDPPQHARLRGLITQSLGHSLLQRLGPLVHALVDSTLEPFQGSGELDLVSAIASPLPVRVICELLGVPAADRELVQPRAAALASAFGTRIPDADRLACDAAVAWLREYLGHLLSEREKQPREDLLTRLAAAHEQGARLSRDEIVDNAVFLFFAGFETTTNLIANGAVALMQDPGALAHLRRERALLGSAIEELLRFDPPIQGVSRLVRTPVELGGYLLRPGRVLILLLGSANRDPRQFDEPDRLSLARSPNPHVSFGGGIHGCLGAALARLEAGVVFSKLLDRFAVLEPAGPPTRDRGTRLRAYSRVPIRVSH